MNSSLVSITHHVSPVDPPTILVYSTLPATRYAPTYPGTSGYPQQITDKAALISPLNSSSLDDCAQEAKLPDQTRNLPEPDVETECLDDELDGHESFDAMASAYNANLSLIQAINQSDKLVVVPKETHLGIPRD